ncbi:hypothetical protein [Komagataeibacter oboediens]|uniref:hypothetical protein n=1 Tax=Komagataeibacter oboediens TaxID=65958 RepID=UPI001905086E|nr:hypothetical protein [Komagataeibacter oboediens]GCE79532.1 hypothetical protein MSKU3_1007 [Komagataeibacter oboediens]
MSYTAEDVERLAEKLFKLHNPRRQWNGQITYAERQSGSDTPVSENHATPNEQAHFRALAREVLEKPL